MIQFRLKFFASLFTHSLMVWQTATKEGESYFQWVATPEWSLSVISEGWICIWLDSMPQVPMSHPDSLSMVCEALTGLTRTSMLGIMSWNPTFPLFKRHQSRCKRRPLWMWEMEPFIFEELKMSHCSLSTLKMGVCSCFIEPDNAIKMKKKKERRSKLFASLEYGWDGQHLFLSDVCCA